MQSRCRTTAFGFKTVPTAQWDHRDIHEIVGRLIAMMALSTPHEHHAAALAFSGHMLQVMDGEQLGDCKSQVEASVTPLRLIAVVENQMALRLIF